MPADGKWDLIWCQIVKILVSFYLDVLHTASRQDGYLIGFSWRWNHHLQSVIGRKIEGSIPGADKFLE
jgi:hypothetical protein